MTKIFKARERVAIYSDLLHNTGHRISCSIEVINLCLKTLCLPKRHPGLDSKMELLPFLLAGCPQWLFTLTVETICLIYQLNLSGCSFKQLVLALSFPTRLKRLLVNHEYFYGSNVPRKYLKVGFYIWIVYELTDMQGHM